MVRELGLEPGQDVEVTVRLVEAEEPLPDGAYDPLRQLIGLVPDGPTDAAARHDDYLYREDPTHFTTFGCNVRPLW